MTGEEELDTLSQRIGATLQGAALTLATAESCTGGWVAEVVTRTAGSSNWFECGFVSYSDAAKTRPGLPRTGSLSGDGHLGVCRNRGKSQ